MNSGAISVPGEEDDRSEVRGRSTIEFPYNDLDDGEAIARAVHAVGGTNCQWDQLAAKLGAAATGGGFRMRVSAARTFGLVTANRGEVTLTDLGLRIVDARSNRSARAEAFLRVPLFKATYEKFKGVSLPPPAAIERVFVQLGVAPKQRDKARNVFMRSARSAGYFDLAPDRLVAPALIDRIDDALDQGPVDVPGPTMGGGGGGTGGSGSIPAALLGLLEKLPEPGTTIPPKRRKALIDAFASTINFLYPEEEDDL